MLEYHCCIVLCCRWVSNLFLLVYCDTYITCLLVCAFQLLCWATFQIAWGAHWCHQDMHCLTRFKAIGNHSTLFFSPFDPFLKVVMDSSFSRRHCAYIGEVFVHTCNLLHGWICHLPLSRCLCLLLALPIKVFHSHYVSTYINGNLQFGVLKRDKICTSLEVVIVN
jgi:hypothetical protein